MNFDFQGFRKRGFDNDQDRRSRNDFKADAGFF